MKVFSQKSLSLSSSPTSGYLKMEAPKMSHVSEEVSFACFYKINNNNKTCMFCVEFFFVQHLKVK